MLPYDAGLGAGFLGEDAARGNECYYQRLRTSSFAGFGPATPTRCRTSEFQDGLVDRDWSLIFSTRCLLIAEVPIPPSGIIGRAEETRHGWASEAPYDFL